MKKTVLSIALVSAIGLVSCDKTEVTDGFTDAISGEDESLRLSESGFDMVKDGLVSDAPDGQYTDGTIDYILDGDVLASVDFGSDSATDEAKIDKGDGTDGKCDLVKDGPKKDKKKKGPKDCAKKVIVEPIVKTDDCDYIVAGVIKYFDKKGDWIATVDFGDGTCDDIATKITDEGEFDFVMDKK